MNSHAAAAFHPQMWTCSLADSIPVCRDFQSSWESPLLPRQLQWSVSAWGLLPQGALAHGLIGDYLACPLWGPD